MKKKKHYLVLFFICIMMFCFSTSVKAASAIDKAQPAPQEGHFTKLNGKWIYRYEDGTRAQNCLLNIDDKIYLFSPYGYRQCGWKQIDGNWYYFGKSTEGYMYTQKWLKADEYTYYYLRYNGQRAEGKFRINGKIYYFNKNGVRWYGWHSGNGKKFYFGTPSQGWKYKNKLCRINKKTYFFKEDGSLLSGWLTRNGYTYYFDPKTNAALTYSQTIDDTFYYFNSIGQLQYQKANLSLASDCAILVDAETGEVLYEKQADLPHANASTTKIMTCILALEKAKLTDIVTVSQKAASQEPVKLYMQAGEKFYLKDLLYSLMLPSHNDTAYAIAEHVGKTSTKFVSLMNKKATDIGCTNTHFATPNGLDAGLTHYSTARDLSLIARYALKYKTIRKLISTSSYSFTNLGGYRYYVSTTNSLLNSLPGVCGMKTGFTNKAKYCFVGLIKNPSGKEYISVTLGGPTSYDRWADSRKLLTYAYNYTSK